MPEIAAALAEEIMRNGEHVARFAERLTPAEWSARLPGEERTVAAVVAHIAWALGAESHLFVAMALGESGTELSQEWLDRVNATYGRRNASAGQAETIARLRRETAAAADRVRELSPDQLSVRGVHMPGEPERSVAGWIEACLIGHGTEHLAQMRRELPER